MSGNQRAVGQLKCWISHSEAPLKFVDFSWTSYSLIYRISDCTLIGISGICVAWLSFHIIKNIFIFHILCLQTLLPLSLPFLVNFIVLSARRKETNGAVGLVIFLYL